MNRKKMQLEKFKQSLSFHFLKDEMKYILKVIDTKSGLIQKFQQK